MSSDLVQQEEPSGETEIPWRTGPKHQSGRPVVGAGRLIMPLQDDPEASAIRRMLVQGTAVVALRTVIETLAETPTLRKL